MRIPKVHSNPDNRAGLRAKLIFWGSTNRQRGEKLQPWWGGVSLFRIKAALYGRIVLGASSVLFGVLALWWHGRLPFGTVIGRVLMSAQIAGGIGVVYPRSA